MKCNYHNNMNVKIRNYNTELWKIFRPYSSNNKDKPRHLFFQSEKRLLSDPEIFSETMIEDLINI